MLDTRLRRRPALGVQGDQEAGDDEAEVGQRVGRLRDRAVVRPFAEVGAATDVRAEPALATARASSAVDPTATPAVVVRGRGTGRS